MQASKQIYFIRKLKVIYEQLRELQLSYQEMAKDERSQGDKHTAAAYDACAINIDSSRIQLLSLISYAEDSFNEEEKGLYQAFANLQTINEALAYPKHTHA